MTTYTSTDQVGAYLRGCHRAVEDARKKFGENRKAETMEAFIEAVQHERRAQLGAYGYPCVNLLCDNGSVPIDQPDRTMPGTIDCPCCGGEGLVLPDEGLRWLDRHPEHLDYECR